MKLEQLPDFDMARKRINTRADLLESAEALFADKGFYGVSISNIATTLEITKQALLHHFKSKENLYAAVLENCVAHLQLLLDGLNRELTPLEQLFALIDAIADGDARTTRVIRLLVRELLDNPQRADSAQKWFLTPLLAEFEGIVAQGQQRGEFREVNGLAFVYQILGAQQYFLISLPTLKGMYPGEKYERFVTNHKQESRQMIQRALLKD